MIDGSSNEKKCPLITIGITCFNAQDTIERAVKSAVNQSWPNFEIIIVNDCSKDNSQEIITKVAGEHENIKVINHEKNIGCSASRNRILHEAKGEFLAFFDDDDFSRRDRLEIQYNKIIKHEVNSKEKLIVCYASGIRFYPNGYVMPFQAIGSREKIPSSLMVVDYLLMFIKEKGYFYGGGTPANSMMARISVYKKAGGFDVDLKRQEDADFAIRLAFLGGTFIGNREELIEQYATFGGDKTAQIEYESSVILFKKNKKYLDKFGSYNYMLSWSRLKCFYYDRKIICIVAMILFMTFMYPVKFLSHVSESGIKRLIHDLKIRK